MAHDNKVPGTVEIPQFVRLRTAGWDPVASPHTNCPAIFLVFQPWSVEVAQLVWRFDVAADDVAQKEGKSVSPNS
jgi:hypothetical protein